MSFDSNQFSGPGPGSDDFGGSSGPPEDPPPVDDLFESILDDNQAYVQRDNHRFLSVGLSFYEKFNEVR